MQSHVACLLLMLLKAVSSGLAENIMDCLVERPLIDVDGNALSPSVHKVRQIRVPQSCVPLICSAEVLVVAWQLGVQFTSVRVDDTTADGQRCMQDVQRSSDNYHKANFPVTFYRAGDLQLVFHDSLCPAYSVDKQRFLLKSMLMARNVQPLEAHIICDGSLQVTRPTVFALNTDGREGRSSRLLTHVTMYSVPQARSSDGGLGGGFVPQYARLELAEDMVVSVLSSCVGDIAKMELINKVGAAWMGALDSCLSLICHSEVDTVNLGYYNYLLYPDRKLEGEKCFQLLEDSGIGAQIDTPLSKVRIVSTSSDPCEGTKFMVLEPRYSRTSVKLQSFLYYQAYKMHSIGCPGLGVECLRRKLVLVDHRTATSGAGQDQLQLLSVEANETEPSDQLPLQCSHLLCDSRTQLVAADNRTSAVRYRVRIDNSNTKELNNVCYKTLRRTTMSRRLYLELGSIEADIHPLGITLVFSLL